MKTKRTISWKEDSMHGKSIIKEKRDHDMQWIWLKNTMIILLIQVAIKVQLAWVIETCVLVSKVVYHHKVIGEGKDKN